MKQKGAVVNGLLDLSNYKPSPILFGGLDVNFFLLQWMDSQYVERFCGDIYIYDFTGFVGDINNDKESNEIDLDVEAPTDEPVNNWVEVSDECDAPNVSDEIARKLL